MELKEHLRAANAEAGLIKIFEAIEQASKVVQSEVCRAGLGADIYGAKGSENIQGEEQQKLDVYADECFIKEFRASGAVAGMASEEQDNALQFDASLEGEYVIMIDPLDGSSNIDVNVAIGTIFAIYKRISPVGSPLNDADFLQAGKHQVAAGYVNYSVSTQIVCSIGKGTHIYTLDPKSKDYHLIKESIQFPADGKVYSINEVNLDDFDEKPQALCATLQRQAQGRWKAYVYREIHRFVGGRLSSQPHQRRNLCVSGYKRFTKRVSFACCMNAILWPSWLSMQEEKDRMEGKTF